MVITSTYSFSPLHPQNRATQSSLIPHSVPAGDFHSVRYHSPANKHATTSKPLAGCHLRPAYLSRRFPISPGVPEVPFHDDVSLSRDWFRVKAPAKSLLGPDSNLTHPNSTSAPQHLQPGSVTLHMQLEKVGRAYQSEHRTRNTICNDKRRANDIGQTELMPGPDGSCSPRNGFLESREEDLAAHTSGCFHRLEQSEESSRLNTRVGWNRCDTQCTSVPVSRAPAVKPISRLVDIHKGCLLRYRQWRLSL